MTFKIKTKMEGVGEAMQRLRVLAEAPRRKVLKRALTKAARIPVKLAKSLVSRKAAKKENRERNGILAKSLGSKIVASASKSSGYGVIGARRGFKTQVGSHADGSPIYEDPAHIAHLVEFGHGGPHPAPAHPFLRPAFDQTKNDIKNTLTEELEKGLLEELRK